jgi:hypothetical protein
MFASDVKSEADAAYDNVCLEGKPLSERDTPMATVSRRRPCDQRIADEPPPDRDTEAGPDPADARWWAQQNLTWDDVGPVPDEVYDRQAEESLAIDRLERGICL